MALKKWKKEDYGRKKYPTYHLTKEANPDWFAKVYVEDGKYTFTIGKRIGNPDEPTPARYSTRHKWKSPITAKAKALEAIFSKQHIEPDEELDNYPPKS